MKRKHFSVEQIVTVLKQAELGMPVADILRQVGILEQTFYRWKKQYVGLQWDQVRELKQLQDENARLKKTRRRTESGQSHSAGFCIKKVGRPALKRDVVNYIVSHYRLKLRRACTSIGQTRSTQYYQSVKKSKDGAAAAHA